MKKKILLSFFIFIIFFNFSFAEENNIKVKVYLDIINNSVDKNYHKYNSFYSQNSNYEKIFETLMKVSDSKVISFYNNLLNIDKKSQKYIKNKDKIDVIIYITVIELITRDNIKKEYIYSNNDWEWYKNDKYWIEFLYPKKFDDWSERKIFEVDNKIFLPSLKEYQDDFIKKEYLKNFDYDNVYILWSKIKNDNDIKTFLENIYWKNCWNFLKQKTNKKDIYLLKLNNIDILDDLENWCNYLWLEKTYYYQDKQEIITLSINQRWWEFKLWESVIIDNTLNFYK